MDKILRGKYLVRKSKSNNGEIILTLVGNFYPQNFNINEIKDNDEMWVSDIIVCEGGIKFTDPINIDGGSPEDFLSGINQSPESWKTKRKL